MDSSKSLVEVYIPGEVVQPLLSASNSSTLESSLESLIEVSKTADSRANLASKNILDVILRLIQSLPFPFPCGCGLLVLSLKLLRNLCAGEIKNQNSFIQQNGAATVLNVLRSAMLYSDPELDSGMNRMGLQVLANVSLAGCEHQHSIWHHFFFEGFLTLAKVMSREVSDPLCMIIFTCCDGNPEFLTELCTDDGLAILSEIIRTTAIVGYTEDWLKLLLSRVCLEEPCFPSLFSKLCLSGGDAIIQLEDMNEGGDVFSSEHAFLLRMVSEILNERMSEIIVPIDFVMCILAVFKKSTSVLDCGIICKSGLPTGSSNVDVLGYTLTILRDICAMESQRSNGCPINDAVNMLLSSGLVELLLCLLLDLEPPLTIRKAMKQGENRGETNHCPSKKHCLYKGFRRDVIAVIGNCAYRREQVQDEIRQKNGILLLLQQCVLDEDNPFLREWGIWSVRNLLQGNKENQRMVAELELQDSVDVPEIAGIGLKVEVDPKTRRGKLVNI